MKRSLLLLLTTLAVVSSSFGQRALSESVSYFGLRSPNQPLDASIKTYNVYVETPYTLTTAELETQSLAEFEEEKANYESLVEASELEFEERLKNYDKDVEKSEERYKMEMKDFKDLTLLERLSLTDQGKKPELVVPAKPRYVKPREPKYVPADLDDHLVFDNEVLADGVNLLGYEKGGNDVIFILNITKMKFQDNGGQTFYSQPTSLKVMKGTDVFHEKNFDEDFQFLTATSSNKINLERYEKQNVNKIMNTVTDYMNQEFGHVPVAAKIIIEYPKNKNREYDILENAKIKALSAYRKQKEDASLETRNRARTELEEVRAIWKAELSKVDYNNKKAVMNKDVARMIFFNLMRVDISLKDKEQAEETLAAMQAKRIDLDLDYDEKKVFTYLEELVYKI